MRLISWTHRRGSKQFIFNWSSVLDNKKNRQEKGTAKRKMELKAQERKQEEIVVIRGSESSVRQGGIQKRLKEDKSLLFESTITASTKKRIMWR
jgi:hypothetical protein